MMTDNPEHWVFNMYLKEEQQQQQQTQNSSTTTATTLVGNCCLRKKEKQGMYELGYWIHGKQTGRGLTTECVKGLIEFARGHLEGATTLIMYVHQGNIGSRRVTEKTGFQFLRNEDMTYESSRPEWGVRVNHYFELAL